MVNQIRVKQIFASKIITTLFWGIFMISIFACLVAPTPVPTLDSNAIATYAFQTAQVIIQQTQAASSPASEFTSTTLPTATASQAPLPTETETEAVIPVTGADCIPANPPQTGRVVEVVDGDTIKVLLDADGKTYSVRYIGMDTPENTSQVEYFGPEATARNNELVTGKTVSLYKDVSETDRYGRLLRYVIADNIFVNYELVAQGYANTASFPPDVACISTFQAAEQQASIFKLGFWGAPPTQVILPLPTAPAGDSGSSGGDAPCNCNGPDLDCGDFSSHVSAQACFNHCRSEGFGDVFRLDADDDGSACESLP
jgi:endonuclease YncB( thermonuclease family)